PVPLHEVFHLPATLSKLSVSHALTNLQWLGETRHHALAPTVRQGRVGNQRPDSDKQVSMGAVAKLSAILELTNDDPRMHLDPVRELDDPLCRVQGRRTADERFHLCGWHESVGGHFV